MSSSGPATSPSPAKPPASPAGFVRPSGRAPDQLRPVSIDTGVNKYAEGSCLIRLGDTHVLCTASVEDKVPGWLKGSGQGWITAEYGMLPRATDERGEREAARGRQSGRSQEIQRLVGRSLRTVTSLRVLNELQVRIDCDVLQADGGTRCAAITGGYVALALACRHLQEIKAVKAWPLTGTVAAVSCGLCGGVPMLDLDYAEDSTAQADANFVLTGDGRIVEVQATAERSPFDEAMLLALLQLARKGMAELEAAQRAALAG